MMETLLLLFLCLFVVPVLVYFSVKLGTWSYLQTKERFEKRCLDNKCDWKGKDE